MKIDKLKRRSLILLMVVCCCMTFVHASVLASGKFDITIAAGESRNAGTKFPMEAGEVVNINAVYSPASADIEFGLVDENGIFYHGSGENGVFSETIEISQRGNYIFAVKNNSEVSVAISGYVNY